MDNAKIKHFERPTSVRPPSLFSLVLLAALFGTCAGFVGYAIADRSNLVSSNQVDRFSVTKINIEQPIVSIARKYQQSVAGVYRPHQNDQANRPKLYEANDYLGAAVVITSDGWLMATDQVITARPADVIVDGKIYQVDEVKIDEFTGVVFIKISGNNLQPIDFQLTDNLGVGERLFTNLDQPNSLEHSYLSLLLAHDHYVPDKYLFSDQVDYYLKLSDYDGAVNLSGAPFFNTEGDVLGVAYKVNADNVLIPSEYLRQAVSHLLDKTGRVSFGAYYIDWENMPSSDNSQGNLIYHPTLRPIVANSVAAKIGLLANDQIIAVNNDQVTSQRTLTAILQDYRIGDKVNIKIIRNGVEQDLEAQL